MVDTNTKLKLMGIKNGLMRNCLIVHNLGPLPPPTWAANSLLTEKQKNLQITIGTRLASTNNLISNKTSP